MSAFTSPAVKSYSVDLNLSTTQTLPSVCQVDTVKLLAEAQNKTEVDLKALLRYLSEAYHNNTALIPDDVYDKLEGIYKSKYGQFNDVGAMPRGVSVKLPDYLGSLDKIKVNEDDEKTGQSDKDIKSFSSKNPGPYVFEDKIDGLTGYYKGGIFYRRGDGEVGDDISIAYTLMNLPKPEQAKPYGVKGEIVMSKAVFAEFKLRKPDAVDARSTVSGIINSLISGKGDSKDNSLNIEFARKLTYIAYEIKGSGVSPQQQLMYLEQWGYKTPWWAVGPTLDKYQLIKALEWRKSIADYEMDGLVIIQDEPNEHPVGKRTPSYAIAFKVEKPSVQTKVLDVIYNPSKDRYLIPTVYFEPVQRGVTMGKATGFNADFIIKNGIGPGAIIRVTRGGDVIPDIVGVDTPATPVYPDFDPNDYEWEGVHLKLKYDTDTVFAKRIEHFVRKLDIEFFGPARVAGMVAKGYKTLTSILNASIADFAQLDRVGEKVATKIYNSIHKSITDVAISTVMAASGIFGRGLGEKRSELVIAKYPNILDMSNMDIIELEKIIVDVDGFGKVYSMQFAARLSLFVTWLKEHPMIIIKNSKSVNINGGISNQLYIGNNNTDAKTSGPSPKDTQLTLFDAPEPETTNISGDNTFIQSIPQQPVYIPQGVNQTLQGKLIIASGFRNNDTNNYAIEITSRGGQYSEDPITKRDSKKTILVYDPKNVKKTKLTAAQKWGVPIVEMEQFFAYIDNPQYIAAIEATRK